METTIVYWDYSGDILYVVCWDYIGDILQYIGII